MEHQVKPGPQWERLLPAQIPREQTRDMPGEDTVAPSMEDHPEDHGYWFPADATYTLKLVPLDDLLEKLEQTCYGGRHGLDCYRAGNSEGMEQSHDIGEPEFDDDGNVMFDDSHIVEAMMKDADRLPPLASTGLPNFFGGGHRTAAWREVGMVNVPCWVPDEA